MKLSEIVKPSLIINTNIVKNNVRRFKIIAKQHNVILRPHFKTHQSHVIANIFKDESIEKITVSSVDMANIFIENGFTDICIAIPFNIRETFRINQINENIKITLCIESIDVLRHLSKHITRHIDVFIKTDTGYNRSGIISSNTKEFKEIIEASKNFKLITIKGFLTHSGHTYNAKSTTEIKRIHQDSIFKLNSLRKNLGKQFTLSIGDTPSISLCNDFTGIDEIRPGNFCFYDLMQFKLGACEIKDIAVRVWAPVIGKNKERNEIVLHAGAVHLSKEFLSISEDIKSFGQATRILNTNKSISITDSNIHISRLSQEHAILKLNRDLYSSISYGDLIEIIPIHSCLTANLLKSNTLHTNTF